MDQSIRIKPLSECTITEVLQAWNEGFKGYYSNVTMTVDAFLARMANEGLSAEHSVVAFAGDDPAGIVINGFRTIGGERVAWNGGTAVAAAYRRQGVGRRLLEASFELYRKEQVTLATLEAIEDNEKAIALYRDMGYSVAGRLLVMQQKGSAAAQAADGAARYAVQRCKPQEAARLDFYEPLAPWQTQWMSARDGEAVIVRDAEGRPAAYGIFKRVFDAALAHTATTLYQCAVQPERQDREAVLRCVLEQVFAADAKVTRRAFNIPADREAAALLQQAGFETTVSQIYMTRRM